MKYRLANQEIKENYGENLLRARGIENVQAFLHPTKDLLQTFEDLDNYQRGVEAIESTIFLDKPYAIIAD